MKITTSINNNADEKVIDSITNENVTKPIKKTPADFGQVNQPVFETLESIRKVITICLKNVFERSFIIVRDSFIFNIGLSCSYVFIFYRIKLVFIQ